MDTNILGLPSFTGFTPLKAIAKGQVLKYDFKDIGPRVIDKSGHGNGGRLMPKEDPPKRKIVSWFPLEVVMVFKGKGDRIVAKDDPTLDITEELTIETVVNPEPATERQILVDKHKPHDGGGYVLINRQDRDWIDFVVRNPEGFHTLRHRNDLPEGKNNRIVCKFTESEISMELNGEVIESETPKIGYIGTNDLDLGIGARFNGEDPFRGTMKKVSISGK